MDEADATMQLDAALDAHERPPERGHQVAFARELSGLYWLDSIIVMLSLGTMSILLDGADVSAAAVATAFLLAPRYAGTGRPVESVASPSTHEVASDALAASGASPAPHYVRAGRLAHAETVAVCAAPQATSGALAELGAREPGAAPSPECGTAGSTGAMPSSLVATLPGAQAHWVALAVDGLPVEAVVRFVRALGTLVTRRVQHVEGVLSTATAFRAHCATAATWSLGWLVCVRQQCLLARSLTLAAERSLVSGSRPHY
jgi:hypothetical protein